MRQYLKYHLHACIHMCSLGPYVLKRCSHLNTSDSRADEADALSSLESAEHPVVPRAVAAHICDGALKSSLDGGGRAAVGVASREKHPLSVLLCLSLCWRKKNAASIFAVIKPNSRKEQQQHTADRQYTISGVFAFVL